MKERMQKTLFQVNGCPQRDRSETEWYGRLLVEDEIACNDLLLRIRTERINAGQINDLAILHIADIADLLIHGDARKIADVLVGAGQHVEQGGFATVLIACECKNHIATS